uniref:coagulation factor X-like n=1 Tax=Myxine glutinosa TaxID=7769 RepID=UPI00358FAA5E
MLFHFFIGVILFVPPALMKVFLQREEAGVFLERSRRANTFWEEFKKGDMERECQEERCDWEEAREIFENEEATKEFWGPYTGESHCHSHPCLNGGICEDVKPTYVCFCLDGYVGINCETANLGCKFQNGGCDHFCQQEETTMSCSCATGYELEEDRKKCKPNVEFPCGRIQVVTRRSFWDDDIPAEEASDIHAIDPPTTQQTSPSSFSRSNSSDQTTNVSSTQSHTMSQEENVNFTEQNSDVVQPSSSSSYSQTAVPPPSYQPAVPPPFSQPVVPPPFSQPAVPPPFSQPVVPPPFSQPAVPPPFSQPAVPPPSSQPAVPPPSSQPAIPHPSHPPKVIPSSSLPSIRREIDLDQRIIGGNICPKGECPWQVMLLNSESKLVCGGTLINPLWVVTAAHCKPFNPIFAVLGEHHRHIEEGTEQKIRIGQTVWHKRYNSQNYDRDIALLRLASAAILNQYVIPACLPTLSLARDVLTGEMATVSGWGRTAYRGLESIELKRTRVPMVDIVRCKESSRQHITKNMFCAGYADASTDSCQGDSGGPHVTKFRDTWFLTGIVSWGEGCAKPGKYGIYTNLSNFLKWVTAVMRKVDTSQ